MSETITAAEMLRRERRAVLQRAQTRAHIQREEGFRSASYLDNQGFLTGGVGHKLTGTEKKLYPLGTEIPKSITTKWFDADLKTSEAAADRLLAGSKTTQKVSLKPIVQGMTFQMGETGTKRFKKFFTALDSDDFTGAASELLTGGTKDTQSLWLQQTPRRALQAARSVQLLEIQKPRPAPAAQVAPTAPVAPRAPAAPQSSASVFRVPLPWE